MTYDDLKQRHNERMAAPEAALGEPNPDFTDPFGPLSVPDLAPSWRELGLVRSLGQLDTDTQAQVIYTLLVRRLPDLTFDEFLDLTAPEHFSPWWQATRAPVPPDQEGGDSGPPSTGRVPSRLSPWRARLSGGSTPPSTASSMPSPP